METHVIACATIKKEMEKAMEMTGKNFPCVFLKPGLDNNPQNLIDAINAEADKLPDGSRILLGFGFSNGALSELPAGRHYLTAPNVEDVICIILGSQKRRDDLLKEALSYFISEGWMKGDNLFGEFDKNVAKYGEAKAGKLHKMMMGNYQRYLLIDTGTYDIEALKARFDDFAKHSSMAVECTKGDLSLLTDLLLGPPWDNRFVTAGPGECIKIDPNFGV